MELDYSQTEVELERVRSQIDRFVSKHAPIIHHQMHLASECKEIKACNECSSCTETKLLRKLEQLLADIELRSSLLKRITLVGSLKLAPPLLISYQKFGRRLGLLSHLSMIQA